VRPIRKGDRGPAVEDVQRRLRALGADLGPTGVDGVFLGATLSAVRSFQLDRGLDEDGDVGAQTWAALVDATFVLGDRLLYLHFPHFHGADVRALQGALNALGFAAGTLDGIFGSFTERAVREFQANVGLPSDGIVGPDTVRALGNLRHVWSDKAPEAIDQLHRAPARSTEMLARYSVTVVPLDPTGSAVASRLQNLALASDPAARVRVATSSEAPPSDVVVVLGVREAPPLKSELPTVAAGPAADGLALRVEVALRAATGTPASLEVVLPDIGGDEQALQRVAVGLLDGLCVGMVALAPPVVP